MLPSWTASPSRRQRGGPRGYDGGKKINGRKRQLLVDTEGLVLKAHVHAAGLHDQEGARGLLAEMAGMLPRLALVWADSAYRGLAFWMRQSLGCDLAIVRHPWSGHVWVPEDVPPPVRPPGFHVLPRRWVVERSFGWLGRNRRLARDYEFLPETEEAFIYVGMMRLMLRRLVPDQ